MLSAKNISKSYNNLQVLKNINLQINSAEVVAIVGSSGAGKSTLLHILGTLDNADSGEIIVNNQPLNSLNTKQLAAFRNKHIGFVFQFHHLLPEFTALENVCIPAFIANTSKKQATNNAAELLNLLGLSQRLHHKPTQLSGGEQQRVAIARALINKPSIVFADEPTGNLDSQNAEQIHQLIIDLNKQLNQTFLIVTHNKELANNCHRIITMKDGEIV